MIDRVCKSRGRAVRLPGLVLQADSTKIAVLFSHLFKFVYDPTIWPSESFSQVPIVVGGIRQEDDDGARLVGMGFEKHCWRVPVNQGSVADVTMFIMLPS